MTYQTQTLPFSSANAIFGLLFKQIGRRFNKKLLLLSNTSNTVDYFSQCDQNLEYLGTQLCMTLRQ